VSIGFASHQIPPFQVPSIGAASFTIYTSTKELFHNRNYLNRDSIIDAALVGGIGGAISGALISFGSARRSIYHSLQRIYSHLCDSF
jgi:hypothetical protein